MVVMPDRLDLGICEECSHSVSEHVGAWCRHRTGLMNDAGRELICCCTEADAGVAERVALIAELERERLARADLRAAYQRVVADRDALTASIQRVRGLHVRQTHTNRRGAHTYCEHCTHDDDWDLTDYPCPTIRALDEPEAQQ